MRSLIIKTIFKKIDNTLFNLIKILINQIRNKKTSKIFKFL